MPPPTRHLQWSLVGRLADSIKLAGHPAYTAAERCGSDTSPLPATTPDFGDEPPICKGGCGPGVVSLAWIWEGAPVQTAAPVDAAGGLAKEGVLPVPPAIPAMRDGPLPERGWGWHLTATAPCLLPSTGTPLLGVEEGGEGVQGPCVPRGRSLACRTAFRPPAPARSRGRGPSSFHPTTPPPLDTLPVTQ